MELEDHVAALPTAIEIEQLVRDTIGLTDPLECTKASDGEEHSVWFVGSKYVVRGRPASPQSILDVRKDARIRNLVRKYSRKRSIIPRFVACVSAYGWIFNIDHRVNGSNPEWLEVNEKTEQDLTNLLLDLASVPVAEAKAIGVERIENPDVDLEIGNAVDSWNELKDCGYVRGQSGYFQQIIDQARIDGIENGDAQQPVLLHGDFKGEHIFVETSGRNEGALCGVIDWSDAAVGDVAIDLADLAISVGQQMAGRIGEKMGLANPTIQRGRILSMCRSIERLHERVLGEDRDSPEKLLRDQFMAAFQGTNIGDCCLL